jgi:hypothetical protein
MTNGEQKQESFLDFDRKTTVAKGCATRVTVDLGRTEKEREREKEYQVFHATQFAIWTEKGLSDAYD